MIRASFFVVLLLMSLIPRGVLADQPYVRYTSGCQLLMNETRIYCFSGGYAKVVNLESTSLADHFYLDVSKGFVVSHSYNLWIPVLDPPNFISEATSAYVSVKLSDTRVLINGGLGLNNGRDFMKNQTVIYHSDTNQWETVSNVSSIPQSYYGSGALTKNNTVVFWGGGNAIGELVPTFNGIANLLMNQQIPKWSLQPSAVAPGNPRYGHTATVDQTGTLIYYLGGRDIIRDPNSGLYTRPYVPFTNVLIYHTETSVWEKKTVTSSKNPSGRMSHTATLIPKTGEIIVYGGAGSDSVGNRTPMSDHIHIYSPSKNTMQAVTVASDNKGAGPRFGHSAVLKNNMLFIMFGIDSTLLATDDFHVFNVDKFDWESTYSTNGTDSIGNTGNNGDANSDNNQNDPKDDDKDITNNNLSSGAIAGICVGIVAAIAILLAFFFIRRRKQKKSDEDSYPNYWDVTSINEAHSGVKEEDVSDIPITSTGQVDVTRIAGYGTTARPNTVNDRDVNLPPAPAKVLLPDARELMTEDQSTTEGSTGTHNSAEKARPPDVYQPSVVTPSSNDVIKPDIGKK